MQLVFPAPFDEALDLLGDRSPIGSAMSSGEWSDLPAELRQRAFFSARVENLRFLQRAKDLLGDFMTAARDPDTGALKTGSRSQFIDQLRKFALDEGMGPLDEESRHSVQDITSEKRLGLIFDVQTRQADDYGYWRQGQDPDVLNEFPAQRFIRVRPVKTEREAHIPFEDQVYLKSDPIWSQQINEDFGLPWGPWGWGCGHDVEDVDRDEAEDLGLIDPDTVMRPDETRFNENLQAGVKNVDPDLIEKMRQVFGGQLVINESDGTIAWNPPAIPQQ